MRFFFSLIPIVVVSTLNYGVLDGKLDHMWYYGAGLIAGTILFLDRKSTEHK